MKKITTFPDLSHEFPVALEKKSIEFNGQVVLFDKKVGLMPVKLEKKEDDENRD